MEIFTNVAQVKNDTLNFMNKDEKMINYNKNTFNVSPLIERNT